MSTDVTPEVFVYIYDRYCGHGTPISRSPHCGSIMRDQKRLWSILSLVSLMIDVIACDRFCSMFSPTKLWDLLTYYKLYPVSRASKVVFGKGYSRNFMHRLHLLERYLASVIDELQEVWDRVEPVVDSGLTFADLRVGMRVTGGWMIGGQPRFSSSVITRGEQPSSSSATTNAPPDCCRSTYGSLKCDKERCAFALSSDH